MSQPDYRVDYGVKGQRQTSLFGWMLGATGLIILSAAVLIAQGNGGAVTAGVPASTDVPIPAPSAGTAEAPEAPATSGIPAALDILPTPEPSAEMELMSYFPLAEGNAWSYQEEFLAMGESPSARGTMLFRVTGVEWEQRRPNYSCELNSDKLYYFLAGPDLIAAKQPMTRGLVQLRAPLVANATWDTPAGDVRCTVKRLDILVTVPVGTFTCLEIEKTPINWEGNLEMMFFAPGIGMVKQITEQPSGDRRTWSLDGYRVGNASAGTLLATPTPAAPASS